MANQPNGGKKWMPQEDQKLKQLIQQDTPTRVMGLKLGRSPEAIQSHANKLGLSTKPTNQSPYNRRPKNV